MKAKELIATAFRGRLPAASNVKIYVGTPCGAHGSVGHDRKTGEVREVWLPKTLDSIGRYVRIHEADHVRFSPRNERECLLVWGDEFARLPEEIRQFMEDVRISDPKLWGRRPEGVCQDAADFAIRDLRNVLVELKKPVGSVETETTICREHFNHDLGVFMRSAAIMRALGAVVPERKDDANAVIREAYLDNYPFKCLLNHAIKVVELIQSAETLTTRAPGGFRECEALIAARKRLGEAIKLVQALLIPAAPIDTDRQQFTMPILPPEPDGSQSNPFRDTTIERLPLLVDTIAHQRNILRYDAMTGPRMRRGSLVPLALGIPGLHFTRRVVKSSVAGGAVMIDASGSMSLTNEMLEGLAKEIPAGFIAYYCAGGEDTQGRITIYAEHGLRAADMPKRIGGGNFCDLAALITLLKRVEQPRILVSDLGFCGGPATDTLAAHSLVRSERANGRLIVVPTIQHAIAVLNGQSTDSLPTEMEETE